MIVITTMNKLPVSCYDCPLCHETYCRGNNELPYQSAQEIRPYNCPLKEISENQISKKDNA